MDKLNENYEKRKFFRKNHCVFYYYLDDSNNIFDIWLFNVGKMSFEDCLLLCITFGVGSIVNTILVTGERIINKINELNKEKKL